VKERGYLVCKQGRVLLRQNDSEGEAHTVSISTKCSHGKPVALVHNHNVNPDPSPQDIEASKEHRILVCVDFRGKVKCYKAK